MWCAHPQPLRGEIFSSWLARCAHANGVGLHVFAQRTFGTWQIWNRDIDRNPPAEVVRLASAAMGVPLASLEGLLVRRFAGLLYPTGSAGGTLPWLAPAGVYHRTRRHHGSAFCPQCLQESGYARLVWRLAWMVHCPRHEVPLRDACPHCDAPFIYHRTWPQDARRWPCPCCEGNLVDGRHQQPVVSMRARTLQRSLTESCRLGWRIVGSSKISALDYATGLRFLVKGLYDKQALTGLTGGLARRRDDQTLGRHADNTCFEHRRITQRALALTDLAMLLEDWPHTLHRAIVRGRVARLRFGAAPAPAWIRAEMRLR